jgi:hypothetical protein
MGKHSLRDKPVRHKANPRLVRHCPYLREGKLAVSTRYVDKSEPFAKKLINLPVMNYVSSVVSNRHINVFAKCQVYKCSLTRQSLLTRK